MIVGTGRILPAFPGAGGSINDDGILDASLTPRIIQPTTFAEISGNKSERTKHFSKILKHARIPHQEVKNMHMWQLCHLAMVVPIADAYYEADCSERAGRDWKIMKKTAKRLKRNFITFESSFGDKFMYQHAMKAPNEMRELHKQFYAYVKRMKACGCKVKNAV